MPTHVHTALIPARIPATLASFLLLGHDVFTPTSGPLHSRLSLPRTLRLQILDCDWNVSVASLPTAALKQPLPAICLL